MANEHQGWQPIATAPDLERIFVGGYQRPTRSVAGYWWWREDCAKDGVAIEYPWAQIWTPIVLPAFPEHIAAPEQDGK